MNIENEKVLPVEQRTACPSHPCEILEQLYIIELKTLLQLSEFLDICEDDAKSVINCDLNINEFYSEKFASATETTPELWLNLQANYDKWMRCNGV